MAMPAKIFCQILKWWSLPVEQYLDDEEGADDE